MKRLGNPVAFGVLVVAVILAPFLFSNYRTYQLAFVGLYLIALLGLDILTGFTGQISLGHGAFMGIGAYTTTILVVDHGVRDLWTIPLGGLVAGVIGLAFGIPATRFAGPYLALATFAIPLAFIGILKRFPHFTGGTNGKNLPQLHSELGWHTNPSSWFYAVCWAVALVMLPLAFFIVRGRFGRALRSVRDSPIAATANGISTAAM
jgi:branched-chain amino acid transport system permease protein